MMKEYVTLMGEKRAPFWVMAMFRGSAGGQQQCLATGSSHHIFLQPSSKKNFWNAL
jgi:hypothetical protein